MKKHLIGLKISKFIKFLLVSVASISNIYGLLILGQGNENWDLYILGSIVLLGLSYISSICEKHFKSKIKDKVIALTTIALINDYKSKLDVVEEDPKEIETNVKTIGQNIVVLTIADLEKTYTFSSDKDGFYLTELPKEIEFNGVRILKENLEVNNVKFVLDVISNKSIVKEIEKADDN